MPVYDYKCAEHGVFHELATMEQGALPCACPQCNVLSPRIIMIAPEVLAMASDKRKAIARNEKAAHEPKVYMPESREQLRERKAAALHGKGCGCHSLEDPGIRKSQVLYMADGSKIFPSQRPWMISH
jgi:putative FmdB family regulatory protein